MDGHHGCGTNVSHWADSQDFGSASVAPILTVEVRQAPEQEANAQQIEYDESNDGSHLISRPGTFPGS
jgi:hypothetical protein